MSFGAFDGYQGYYYFDLHIKGKHVGLLRIDMLPENMEMSVEDFLNEHPRKADETEEAYLARFLKLLKEEVGYDTVVLQKPLRIIDLDAKKDYPLSEPLSAESNKIESCHEKEWYSMFYNHYWLVVYSQSTGEFLNARCKGGLFSFKKGVIQKFEKENPAYKVIHIGRGSTSPKPYTGLPHM
ncbi:hypothetical protein EJF36_19095 [Bacillus sp. HMF5848]|uniref:hypothetical protein n=1 Tax=Bacillus sp. HMF5848 TaxID=2495421 RepID=UPI000F7689FD|nr:hypothetical protein [Bacillus sp. HMF5848]RSK28812.1 hypothetical protein EJF36_19095 [Bacillus sp. HMF5848]